MSDSFIAEVRRRIEIARNKKEDAQRQADKFIGEAQIAEAELHTLIDTLTLFESKATKEKPKQRAPRAPRQTYPAQATMVEQLAHIVREYKGSDGSTSTKAIVAIASKTHSYKRRSIVDLMGARPDRFVRVRRGAWRLNETDGVNVNVAAVEPME